MITFTLFPTLSGSGAQEYATDTAGLVQWLRELPVYPDKASCPLISANRYGDRLTAKGSTRHDANIDEVTGLIGDYDAGTLTLDAAADLLGLYGIEAVLVTTPSHGPKGHRWRVICPLAQGTTVDRRHELLGRVNTALGGVLASESFAASQSFYVGPVAGAPYEVRHVPGAPVDTLDHIEPTAPERAHRTYDGGSDLTAALRVATGGVEQVKGWLARIPNDEPDWDRWNRIGMAVFAATAGDPDGMEAWRTWSDRCMGPGADSVEARWRHYAGSPPTDLGAGTLAHLAGPEPTVALPPKANGVAIPYSASPEAFGALAARNARLVRFNGAWYTREEGGYYREIAEEMLRGEIRRASPDKALKVTHVNQALDEIKGAVAIDSHGVELPYWMGDNKPGGEIIVCHNGILDPQSRTMHPHSDDLFTLNALPFDYDPSAPAPLRWVSFLGEVFAGDAESIRELQKLIGYLLTLDTSLQKIFAIIGPRRSGKGTIGRVIGHLLGADNVCSPSFTTVSKDFGLQSFIGKQLALFPDARTGKHTDKTAVAERMLSISGEDAVDIPRKHQADWHGKLDARILILSNDLPVFGDASGALAGRYVVFHTPRSFYDREDTALTDTLRGELPGILNWALDGLDRLRQDRTIRTPAAAKRLTDDLEYLGSPLKGFVADCCALDPAGEIAADTVWTVYCRWHQDNGLPGRPQSRAMFGRDLETAYPGQLSQRRTVVDGRPERYWTGLRLLTGTFNS